MHHSFLFVLTKTKFYVHQKFSGRKENTKKKVKLYIYMFIYKNIKKLWAAQKIKKKENILLYKNINIRV